MGETTIEWANYTFNPWQGCQRVSPGCVNCYAEARDQRFTKGKNWGPGGTRTRTSPANWRKPLAWNAKAQREGKRYRVFCASLADVFEDRPELAPWRLELLELIRVTTNLDWLLLTKRPESVLALLREARRTFSTSTPLYTWLTSWLDYNRPPPNVWIGTTVEDQQRANERIPALLQVPAAVRFLSCEPLLEPVDLMAHRPRVSETYDSPLLFPDWVIIGGESGRKARPFDLAWARDLVRQAREAGAAPFVKQLGRRPVFSQDDLYEDGPAAAVSALDEHRGGFGSEWEMERLRLAGGFWLRDAAGGDPNEWPPDLRIREFPR